MRVPSALRGDQTPILVEPQGLWLLWLSLTIWLWLECSSVLKPASTIPDYWPRAEPIQTKRSAQGCPFHRFTSHKCCTPELFHGCPRILCSVPCPLQTNTLDKTTSLQTSMMSQKLTLVLRSSQPVSSWLCLTMTHSPCPQTRMLQKRSFPSKKDRSSRY